MCPCLERCSLAKTLINTAAPAVAREKTSVIDRCRSGEISSKLQRPAEEPLLPRASVQGDGEKVILRTVRRC